MNSKIVDLGQVRRLLAEWDAVRVDIANGRVSAWAAVDEAQTNLRLGGTFRNNTRAALQGLLKMVMARTLAENAAPAQRLKRS